MGKPVDFCPSGYTERAPGRDGRLAYHEGSWPLHWLAVQSQTLEYKTPNYVGAGYFYNQPLYNLEA
jgi:hypothetical protein